MLLFNIENINEYVPFTDDEIREYMKDPENVRGMFLQDNSFENVRDYCVLAKLERLFFEYGFPILELGQEDGENIAPYQKLIDAYMHAHFPVKVIPQKRENVDAVTFFVIKKDLEALKILDSIGRRYFNLVDSTYSNINIIRCAAIHYDKEIFSFLVNDVNYIADLFRAEALEMIKQDLPAAKVDELVAKLKNDLDFSLEDE